MKAINYLLVLMLLVGVISCGEDVEKAAVLPPVEISDISDSQVQEFIKAIEDSDKEQNGWRLYPNIEYGGNGEMRVSVNYRWFSASTEMAIGNVITVYKLWLSTARNKDVSLLIMFEDFEYIKFHKGEGKVVISDEDKKRMIKRVEQHERATSNNRRLKLRVKTTALSV